MRDLEEIWRYTEQQWGKVQAAGYVDQLNEAFQVLTQSPSAGLPCDHIRAGYRRYRVERHVVYFRQAEHVLIVVRVLHERMDAARRL